MSSTAAPQPYVGWSWEKILWFGGLLVACYAPAFWGLVRSWDDPDMGHGYFVPAVAAFIIWQERQDLMLLKWEPSWWGLLAVLWGGAQVVVATLGAELFLTRTGLVIALIGIVWTMGGRRVLRRLAFPLGLLFFMVPIPAILYTRITFPLQLLASRLAEGALTVIDIPVMRQGNVLELPNHTLSVVEACSGIRSLLSLTFLSLVYGYFFEARLWVRAALFVSTIPIAILANGGRVTITGIMTQIKPELAEGFYHESTGWVIFMIALAILLAFHRLLVRLPWTRREGAAA
jgi:exosortase